MSGPVLPWACETNDGVSTTTIPGAGAQANEISNSLKSSTEAFPHLAIGQRIRVKWELSEPETLDGSKCRWWGASVAEASQDGYLIKYDAYQEFPEELSKINILSKDFLQHEGSNDILRWRLEALSGDCSDTEGDDDLDDTLELSDILEETAEFERELGTSVEEAALAGLETLEPSQQLRLAAGFREFSDHVKEALRARMQAADSTSYTVTAEDVHAILQGFRRV
eukprot:jgi/Botrbrau1/4981/Bobra.0396s0009.1